MSTTSLTIGETIEQLHGALRDYIEATYHISHPTLITQRQQLLDEVGVIHQRPYLESTPRYKIGAPFRDLGLDSAVLEIFSEASRTTEKMESLVHDPPYHHQAAAVEQSLVKKKSLMVTTGTGSGKTECFLLPILGKLAQEASENPDGFRNHAALRAILLYPMNALVNDQLGRLRLLFGNKRIVDRFKAWSGRPARFARYTSRTLYPGVRDPKKDQIRLRPFREYYVRFLEQVKDSESPGSELANRLIKELRRHGKWPAKPDLLAWYGEKGSRWRDMKTGEFKRCVTLPDDPELLTRHEVLEAPPDILVTNYSMLEYMLMRPIERPIFDKTRTWLEANPDENLLLVVDEAHLYRGAAGAEVALLLRRLRTRLRITQERLQVICTSASFQDPHYASEFGAQLTGKNRSDFVTIKGDLLLREGAAPAGQEEAEVLAQIDLAKFYEEDSEEARLKQIESFLEYRGVEKPWELHSSLYESLVTFPAMGRLINLTMKEAYPVDSLGPEIFKGVEESLASEALTVLIALGSLARREPSEPGLLPCRVHAFFRGLPGLWACMDSDCSELSSDQKNGPTGKLYAQPRDVCGCGARVLELYTCRICGSAYARAYTDNLDDPDFLWGEAGGEFRTLSGMVEGLAPIDLLLESPSIDEVEPAEFDLVTGRLNPHKLGTRTRQVYLCKERFVRPTPEAEGENGNATRGQFRPCAVCGQMAAFGRSSVQDHQTKGDQPFQALITKQIQVQAPNPQPATRFAPLRGRKVLVFSDSRQTAARLAPNLQTYSTQDAIRPLIMFGYDLLKQSPVLAPLLSLEDLYLAVLVAAHILGVRLRPELKSGESFNEPVIVEEAVKNNALPQGNDLLQLFMRFRSATPPASLLRAIMKSLTDKYYGMESLALATIREHLGHSTKIQALPDIPGIADSLEKKLALGQMWLRCWHSQGFWLSGMPHGWWQNEVRGHSGNFSFITKFLQDKTSRRVFGREWLPELLRLFAEQMAPRVYRLKGSELSLMIGGNWGYCQFCRTTQRPFPGSVTCVNCGRDAVKTIDPDQDSVFVARKGYYRASTVDALKSPPVVPMALVAAEHTAQLNAARAHEVFSTAEEHELLFQDIDLGATDGQGELTAIDVLSSTTTMEVGIDIGTLSGVSLRNMPPARANYQQRSGRAGRRGNAVATVTAFGSADSHDEHYFSHPDYMIRGAVDDPRLTLDNYEITRRHVTAYLLQRYHQEKLPDIKPEDQPHLFAVLGTVADFLKPTSILNREDFGQWLNNNKGGLKEELDSWLPQELAVGERKKILEEFPEETLAAIDAAIDFGLGTEEGPSEAEDPAGNANMSDTSESTPLEAQPEEGEERPGLDAASENLLDRLLYKGVLPRYAFPTDVATFHVFDRDQSTRYRPAFHFAPSQGLSIALSQYAPGKEVWIGGKLWTSGAIYSPMSRDLDRAWQDRRLYYECSICHYANTVKREEGVRGEWLDCPACGGVASFGKARYWLRPPGFAHPVDREEGTSPDDQPARSYATRAKLTAPTPADPTMWTVLNEQLRVHYTRQHLLVTNRGPRQEGYSLCLRCGRIEPTATPVGSVVNTHSKPFPDERDQNCPGGLATRGLVLGTDFISDVLLISLKVDPPLTVFPGLLATDVALRTLCEALTKAACARLELEAGELQAEYRPALTPGGRSGEETEIYIYDTLPGGAGFSRRTGHLGLLVFEEALQILESCPDGCDRSCYRCLRSYKNKFEHDLLDRHLGASLLRYLLTGAQPKLDATRLEESTELLFQDLERQGAGDVKFERNREIVVPGLGKVKAPIFARRGNGMQFIIALHGPLTPDEPPSSELRDLREYYAAIPLLLRDEIVVRRNLPRATSDLMNRIRSGLTNA